MFEEEKGRLLQLWQSTDSVNNQLADELFKSIREELPEYLANELICARTLLLEFRVCSLGGMALEIHNSWLKEKHASRKSKLARLGFQGTRLLQRTKRNVLQFFCGRSKPTFEIEFREAFYRMHFKDGGIVSSKRNKASGYARRKQSIINKRRRFSFG